MGKYELKTKKNKASVTEFLNSIEDPRRKKDSKAMDKLMREITGKKPQMWGESIVGYDTYHYKYASGQEGDWMAIGFSPRKQTLSLYLMGSYVEDNLKKEMEKLGPHSRGKSCVYIKDLDKLHMPTLKKVITKSYNAIKAYKWDK